MLFNTNKEKGNSSLGIAIAYYASNGYIVSIPLNDTQDYDLIVDNDKTLKRVQVKSSGCKTKYGNYQVALKSCGGTKGKTYKTIIETNVDEVFILLENLEKYIILDNGHFLRFSSFALCWLPAGQSRSDTADPE